MHAQGGDLEQAYEKLPASFNTKAVIRPDLLVLARQKRPGIGTTLRHWADDMQQFDGDWEQRKNRARQFFSAFVDQTFREQYAAHVTVVQFFNEIWANSQSPAEKQARVEQDRAAAVVWNQEYRSQSDYAHIELALSSAAVGNDLPIELAQLAIDEGCILTYHPYIAVHFPEAGPSALHILTAAARATFRGDGTDRRPYRVTDERGRSIAQPVGVAAMEAGQRSPGDWQWCSGRFSFMEQAWGGLKPRWLLTEGSVVRDYTGGLILDPMGGWKLIWGDSESGRQAFYSMLSAWFADMQGTAAFQEGRVLGWHPFTTGGGSLWQWFELSGAALLGVADLIAANWTVTEPPPPPPPPPAGDTRSFEGKDNWINLSGRLQQPNGFTLTVTEAGQPLRYAGKVATGTVEAKHMICLETVPANECVGEPNAVILDGTQSFKIQAVSMASGTSLATVFEGTGRKRIVVPVRCHYQPPDVYGRVPPLEGDDVYAALWLNGAEVARLQFPELEDRKWWGLVGDADAPVTAELYFQTSYPNSRDLFTDLWEAEDMEPTDGRAYGIDVSRWQGAMNWPKAKTAGVQFAFIKSTEGTGWVDPRYTENVAGARAQGILCSAYHYYKPGFDPTAQADHFWNTVQERGDLRMVLDVEEHEAGIAEKVTECLLRLRNLSGWKPILYTSISFWNNHLKTVPTELCDLWIADWTMSRQEPILPEGWAAWRFWQYTSDGDGAAHGAESARIDLNRFNGTIEQLREYAMSTIPDCVHIAAEAVRAHRQIQLNPGTALYDKIKADGREVITSEHSVTVNSISYKYRYGRDAAGKVYRYVTFGPNWSQNMQVFEVA